jgi:hypothetical protein
MACVPVMGHVNPLEPVAEAFTEAGRQVLDLIDEPRTPHRRSGVAERPAGAVSEQRR